MASQDIEIRIKTALDSLGAQNGVKELNKSLKDLKGLALEVGDSNEAAFKQITQAIGQAKDRIGDLNAVIKSASGEPIENLTNSFNGLKNSIFTLDFQSAKRQFTQLQDSIGGLKNQLLGGEIFKNFNKSLDDGASGFKVASAAARDFGKALIATGIGAFIVAVGLLIAYYDDLKNAGGVLGNSMKTLGVILQGVSDTIYSIGVNLGLVAQKDTEASRQIILNKEKEIEALNELNQKYEDQLDLKVRLLAAAGKQTIDQEIQNNKDLIDNRNKTLTELTILGSKYLTKLSQQSRGEINLSEDEIKSYEKKIEENDKQIKAIERANQKSLDDNQVLLVKKQKLETDANNKRAEENKRTNKKIQDDNDAAAKAKAVFDNNATIDAEKQAMAISDLMEEYNVHYTQLDLDWAEIQKQNKYLTNADIIKQLEETYKARAKITEDGEKELADIAKRRADEDIVDQQRFLSVEQFKKDTKISNAEFDRLWQEEAAKNEMATYDEILAAVVKRYQGEVDAAKKARDDKFQMAQDFVTGITNLNEVVGTIELAFLKKGTEEYDRAARRKFNINKALQISSAIITGIQTTMSAFKNGMDNPVPLLGPATAAVYATMAALTSAAQIAKIASTQYQSTTNTSGPPPSSGPPPTLPGPLQSSGLQAPSTIGLGQMNITPQSSKSDWQKVYVVESDIRNTTNRVEVIETRSKLGS
jgi:hypothetical protein